MANLMNHNIGRNWSRKSIERIAAGLPSAGGNSVAINYFIPFAPLNTMPGVNPSGSSPNYNFMCFPGFPFLRKRSTSLGFGYYTVSSDDKISSSNNRGISGVGVMTNSKGEKMVFSVITKPRQFAFGEGATAYGDTNYFILNSPYENFRGMNYPPIYGDDLLVVGDDPGFLYDYGQWNQGQTAKGNACIVGCVDSNYYTEYNGSGFYSYSDENGDIIFTDISEYHPNVYILPQDTPADLSLEYFGDLNLYTADTNHTPIQGMAEKNVNGTVTRRRLFEIRNNGQPYALPIPGLNCNVLKMLPSVSDLVIKNVYDAVKAETPGYVVGTVAGNEIQKPYRYLTTITIGEPDSGRVMSDNEKEFYLYMLIRKFCETNLGNRQYCVPDMYNVTTPSWGAELPVYGRSTGGTQTITYNRIKIVL